MYWQIFLIRLTKRFFLSLKEKLYEDEDIAGDVKYHLGFTSVQKCNNGNEIKLNLTPNPSHLEAVDPVVEGITRAKLDNEYKGNVDKIYLFFYMEMHSI